MATVTITDHLVCPTENDVNGGTSGAGRIPTEDTLGKLWRNPSGLVGYVISGWTFPSSGSRTGATCTGGTACIDGYVITGTGTYSFTFDDATTNYMWLQLVFVSGKVTSVQVQSYTGATTYPANAVYLGTVVTSGGNITGTTFRGPQNRIVFGRGGGAGGTITDTGSNHWSISRGGVGTYTLTFGAGVFGRTPCVIASGKDTFITASPTSATSCSVLSVNSGGTATDGEFSFQAMI